ncbi:hypothetical protein NXS19_006766 [Fusarium pseudograminearum]|nr:hypothetical protein NXS19_006766 [Fusarium pseudograminearum]
MVHPKAEKALQEAKRLLAQLESRKRTFGKSYYELLDMDPDPERRELWNANMVAVDELLPVVGMFPFTSLKEEVEQDPDRPFLVDIGAGRGQSCIAIRKDIGDAFDAKYILQEDLPGVINTMDPKDYPDFELMTYDAFTPQPVKNARIYFMRRFLHDFYAPVCIEFVKNTASAMGPDSRIICDQLILDTVEQQENVDLYWLDLSLLCMSGQEKKRSEFEEILGVAGLELVKVYPSAYGCTVYVRGKT